MSIGRIAKHLLIPDWWAHRKFSKSALDEIDSAVHESEKLHRGELCFVLEGDLDLSSLLRGMSSRERAEEVFSLMRVWDTEENSGVLIYVQLIDRRIDIVADRGINAKVAQADWDTVCSTMQSAFHLGEYRKGSLDAIHSITALLKRHFPGGDDNPDELPNRPVRL